MTKLSEEVIRGVVGDDLVEQFSRDISDEKRIDHLMHAYRNIDHMIQAKCEYIDSIKKEIDQLRTRQEAIKGTLVNAAETMDEPRLRGSMGTFYRRRLPQKAVVVDEKLIPQEHLRVKYDVKPNLVSIRDALMAGESIPGVALSNGGETWVLKWT